MLKKIILPLLLSSFFLIGCIGLITPTTYDKSNIIEGNVTLEKVEKIESSPQRYKVFEKIYKGFPPIISHSIKNMPPITKIDNNCLSCHTPKHKAVNNFYSCLNCHTQSN